MAKILWILSLRTRPQKSDITYSEKIALTTTKIEGDKAYQGEDLITTQSRNKEIRINERTNRK